VVIFGLILLLIGFVTGIPLVWTIGVIVLLVGLALWLLGSLGTQLAVDTTTTRSTIALASSGKRQHFADLCLGRYDRLKVAGVDPSVTPCPLEHQTKRVPDLGLGTVQSREISHEFAVEGRYGVRICDHRERLLGTGVLPGQG